MTNPKPAGNVADSSSSEISRTTEPAFLFIRFEEPCAQLVRTERNVFVLNPHATFLGKLRKPHQIRQLFQNPLAVRGDEDSDAGLHCRNKLARKHGLHLRVQVGFWFFYDQQVSRLDDMAQIQYDGRTNSETIEDVFIRGNSRLPAAWTDTLNEWVVNLRLSLYLTAPCKRRMLQILREIIEIPIFLLREARQTPQAVPENRQGRRKSLALESQVEATYVMRRQSEIGRHT